MEKMFDIIRSMYEQIKLQVKCLSTLSDLFSCDVGLLQGELLSPFLFSLFVNDIELYLQQNINDGIDIEILNYTSCCSQLMLYYFQKHVKVLKTA